jgi:hypothetical protein
MAHGRIAWPPETFFFRFAVGLKTKLVRAIACWPPTTVWTRDDGGVTRFCTTRGGCKCATERQLLSTTQFSQLIHKRSPLQSEASVVDRVASHEQAGKQTSKPAGQAKEASQASIGKHAATSVGVALAQARHRDRGRQSELPRRKKGRKSIRPLHARLLLLHLLALLLLQLLLLLRFLASFGLRTADTARCYFTCKPPLSSASACEPPLSAKRYYTAFFSFNLLAASSLRSKRSTTISTGAARRCTPLLCYYCCLCCYWQRPLPFKEGRSTLNSTTTASSSPSGGGGGGVVEAASGKTMRALRRFGCQGKLNHHVLVCSSMFY